MNETIKKLISYALHTAIKNDALHTEQHTQEYADALGRLEDINPAALRGMIFVTVEDLGGRLKIHCVVQGATRVVEVLKTAAELAMQNSEVKEFATQSLQEILGDLETDTVVMDLITTALENSANDCPCEDCVLRRDLENKVRAGLSEAGNSPGSKPH